jgi:hypothetical protein
MSLPRESWSFSIEDYAIQHQGIHVIDMMVNYDYRPGLGATNPLEYPDFVPVAGFMTDFLVDYPNERDFWEILNRKLVEALLTDPIPTPWGSDYRLAEVVDRLSLTLTVHPEISIPFTRSSTVEQEVVVGTDASDRLRGDIYGDAIRAGDGDDLLIGASGDDYLSGGARNDRLLGGDGADILVGGPGADVFIGGSGADTFIVSDAGNSAWRDRVLDFNASEGDAIDLSGIDAAPGGSDDSFVLVSKFNGQSGDLIIRPSDTGRSVLLGDLDGDRNYDLAVVVLSSSILEAGDLIL